MAVNSITFGGVNSADFGIYISGEGVFNAPKRDVEMIKIPGRNGEFALDNGRFENIEVTYPAFNFEPDDYDTFMQNLSDFRNAICSQRGYQRLTDTFHPDEYRMATFIDGLEVKPIKYNTASEFTITFDCKPQRWLVSGETAVTVTSGDTLTNPTLFESSPLLEVAGPGTINFNGYEIELSEYPYGEIVVVERGNVSQNTNIPIDTSRINIGDTMYPEIKECRVIDNLRTNNLNNAFTSAEVTSTTNVLEVTTQRFQLSNRRYLRTYIYPDFGDGFIYGTAKTISCSASVAYVMNGVSHYTESISITIDYEGADSFRVTASSSSAKPSYVVRDSSQFYFPTMYADSTAPNPAPINIDCDLGEAYYIKNGEYTSLNQYIDLGSELPKLASGSNTVTFDNTITQLKVTPRYWKV